LQVVWREELEGEGGGVEEGAERGIGSGIEEEWGEQLAYMFYTSGSTGIPKGVLVEHAGVRNHVWAKVETLGLGSGDVVAQNASQSFDVSIWQMVSALVVGGRVEVISGSGSRDGGRLLEEVGKRGVTVMEVVPSQLRGMVAEEQIQAIGCLKWLYVMGEVFEPELYEKWRRRYPHVGVVNGYGATECSDDVAQWKVEGVKGERLPIGRALSNLQVYVMMADGELARPGEVGEIYIGGVGVGRGYQGESRRTAERFVPDGWSGVQGGRLYRTGDLGMWNEEGEMEFLGRVDEQVKVRGHRVEPGEVEAVLRSLGGVKEAAVVVREERLVGFVEGEGVEGEQLRKQLRERLPEYLVPAAVVVLAELPRTAGGKLDRPRLPAKVEVERETAETEKPQGRTEELLAEIWAEVLGSSSVGRYDNFFELGGDSILTIQIAARARQHGIKISATDIFQHQTIEELAAVAQEEVATRADQGNVAGPAALTPIQARFFKMPVVNPQHWNVTVLLQTTVHLHAGLLAEAFKQVVLHHDSLRLRFKWDGIEWQQDHFENASDAFSFVMHNLDGLSDSKLAGAIEEKCDLAQRRLNLTKGPLVAAEYFDCGPERPSRLLIIIHHLVVDAVSWRFIVEDLQKAYRQLEQGIAIELPLKTSSYQQWGSRLVEYSHSLAIRNELDFWRDASFRKTAKLFVDFQDGANLYGTARSTTVRLTERETDALVRQVPQAFRLRVDEVLLASVIRSLAGLAEGPNLSIDIESHGREHPFTDLDISRTTGWFTTIYPVAFEIPQNSTPLAAVKAVKAALAAVPNHGIAYGIARYFKDEKGEPEFCPPSQIAFNHLGGFDRTFDERTLFRPAGEFPGSPCDAMALRPYLLEINSIVLNGHLDLAFTYSSDQFSSTTIESVAARCLENLRKFLAYTVSAEFASADKNEGPMAPDNSTLEVGVTLV
jgi:amino acid adenylation domain-containing protein/non-ribosomal peptide synthase protein (TIGR01720 family)